MLVPIPARDERGRGRQPERDQERRVDNREVPQHRIWGHRSSSADRWPRSRHHRRRGSRTVDGTDQHVGVRRTVCQDPVSQRSRTIEARIAARATSWSYARSMTSILLVEDDTAIAQPLVRALEREGFEVSHVRPRHRRARRPQQRRRPRAARPHASRPRRPDRVPDAADARRTAADHHAHRAQRGDRRGRRARRGRRRLHHQAVPARRAARPSPRAPAARHARVSRPVFRAFSSIRRHTGRSTATRSWTSRRRNSTSSRCSSSTRDGSSRASA